MAGKLQPPLPTSWDFEAGTPGESAARRNSMRTAGFDSERLGCSERMEVSIMMRKIAIGLVAAAIATAGSTLSASAIPGGGGGDGGGGAYVDVVRFGGGGFGRGGFGRGGFGHRGFGFGRGF